MCRVKVSTHWSTWGSRYTWQLKTLLSRRAPWSPEESTRGGVASLPLQIFRHQASRWQSRLLSCSCPSGPKEGASLQTHRLRTCSKLRQESNEWVWKSWKQPGPKLCRAWFCRVKCLPACLPGSQTVAGNQTLCSTKFSQERRKRKYWLSK